MTLSLFRVVAFCVVFTWPLIGMMLGVLRSFGRARPRAMRALFAELKPFYLPAVFALYLTRAIQDGFSTWRVIAFLLNVLCWYLYRNEDDDDRWKRRRKKATEAVKALGGRLVVVPAGGR